MALVHADFVEETTTTTGTGTLNLAGATTGHRTFVSTIGNGNTCVYAIAASDGTFESGIGTVTDASPDTLARTTLLSSSTGSKLDLPAGTHRVYCTFAAEGGAKAYAAAPWDGDIADIDLDGGTDIGAALADGDEIVVRDASASANRVSALNRVRTYVQLADVTGASDGDNSSVAVYSRVVTDISGYTTNRTTTLPATFAVGDLVEVYVSTGDDTYAQIIAPAAGDTIDGGTAGAEWSRLFLAGEKVRFRGVVANSAWTVDYDGRIASVVRAELTTACDGESAWTFTYPTDKSGAWTENEDNAAIHNAATGLVTVRRAGVYEVTSVFLCKDAPGSGATVVAIDHSASDDDWLTTWGVYTTAAASVGPSYSTVHSMPVGGTFRIAYQTGAGNLGLKTGGKWSVVEQFR